MWHRWLLNEAHENRQKIFSAAKNPPLLIIPLSNESTAEEFLFLSKPHDPGHHLHFPRNLVKLVDFQTFLPTLRARWNAVKEKKIHK